MNEDVRSIFWLQWLKVVHQHGMAALLRVLVMPGRITNEDELGSFQWIDKRQGAQDV
jgi:hypothetical protein